MSLWMHWWNAIWQLRPAFSRLKNLPLVRHRRGRLRRAYADMLGVTSIVRAC